MHHNPPLKVLTNKHTSQYHIPVTCTTPSHMPHNPRVIVLTNKHTSQYHIPVICRTNCHNMLHNPSFTVHTNKHTSWYHIPVTCTTNKSTHHAESHTCHLHNEQINTPHNITYLSPAERPVQRRQIPRTWVPKPGTDGVPENNLARVVTMTGPACLAVRLHRVAQAAIDELQSRSFA